MYFELAPAREDAPPSPRGAPRVGGFTPFSVPRTDTTTSTTVLSTLQGAHSVGEGILGYFTTAEAGALRLVCSEMREAVAGAAWFDMKTRIKGSLASWRACFPKARAANVSKRRDSPLLISRASTHSI